MKPWYKMFFRSASSGLATELEKGNALGAFRTQPASRVGARQDFFIWIGHNPLERPDPEK
jgi:hypothetical protein